MSTIVFGIRVIDKKTLPWEQEGGMEAWWLDKIFRNPSRSRNCPIKIINSFPGCILTLHPTVVITDGLAPVMFDPKKLTATNQDREKILQFCKCYDVEVDGKPVWWVI